MFIPSARATVLHQAAGVHAHGLRLRTIARAPARLAAVQRLRARWDLVDPAALTNQPPPGSAWLQHGLS